jgi:ATP-dependent DNA helicase PIF1
LEKQRQTELTAFFKVNAEEKMDKEAKGEEFDPGHMPTYVDMPKHYTYNRRDHKWMRRKGAFGTIGRVHTINPLAGDTFYLRMLLHQDHCKGKESYKALQTLPTGRICDTYKEVGRELGLLDDDQEWERVLDECVHNTLCPQIRELYVVILMFCQPANPRDLFDQFWETWIDDFNQQAQHRRLSLDLQQSRTMVLLDLQLRLQSFEKDLTHFGLPVPTEEELTRVEFFTSTEPVVIREEKDYNVSELAAYVEEVAAQFTEEQQTVFNTINNAVLAELPLQIFIDARGGCGKTFLLNAILDAVRSMEPGGCIALATATTGIAADLLHLGRTFHSRFKAPLTAAEDSTLLISGKSSLAKLVKMAKLVLVDEATMLHRYLLEAMDRTFRDIMDKEDQPFGGKIVVLAGDFRQCLPVVQGASRAGTVNSCINQSHLWRQFQILTLTVNMRVRASGDPILEDFDKWTLSLGNGTADTHLLESFPGQVVLPVEMTTMIESNTEAEKWKEGKSMEEFCKMVFPNLETNINEHNWLEGRAILSPTNKEVDIINDLMESRMPGNGIRLSSADTLENPADAFRFNTEYLNTLNPNGFSRHILTLKPGIPLMLLRNINPREGLCNGTRLIFREAISAKLLRCTISRTGREVLIPRITFLPKEGLFPFHWARRQFPVRVAFAVTINKAQGQTMRHIGVWLRNPVFGHGQLYVAASRVGSPDHIKFAIKYQTEELPNTTSNVVYREVLLAH